MLDWLKADCNCVVVRRGGEQWKASLLVRTKETRFGLDALASLRVKWRSRETRWAQTGNGPAETTPEREREASMKKADMGGHRVIGDRTAGIFRCSESGIPAAAQVKGRRVTEPPYELGSA